GSEKNRVGTWFEGGNLETFREGIEASGSSNGLQYSGSFSRTDQGGRFARDRFSKDAVSANIGYKISPSLEVQTGVNYLRDDQDLFYDFETASDPTTNGLLVNINPDTNSHIHRDSVVGHVTVKATPKSWWRSQLDYGLFFNREHLTNSDIGDTAPP